MPLLTGAFTHCLYSPGNDTVLTDLRPLFHVSQQHGGKRGSIVQRFTLSLDIEKLKEYGWKVNTWVYFFWIQKGSFKLHFSYKGKVVKSAKQHDAESSSSVETVLLPKGDPIQAVFTLYRIAFRSVTILAKTIADRPSVYVGKANFGVIWNRALLLRYFPQRPQKNISSISVNITSVMREGIQVLKLSKSLWE